ncbi:MAG: DUF58 domain-containing protein [Spirochaetaceae bacterium]|jgi:uncharacterized protein (DUF58 family)|nr:DUF58 domain-containing protein [Spirochaetaceae bacterium]
MKIHWEKLLPLLLVIFLCLLAGRYLGGTYLMVYRFLMTLLLGNALLFCLGWIGLRYNQHFSKEHIQRGETIEYSFYLQQTQPLSSHQTRLDFLRSSLSHSFYPDSLALKLKGNKREEKNYRVQALHRGIYEAGLQQILLYDLFGLWEAPVGLFPRTFYVYPRIYGGMGVPPQGLAMEGDKEAQGVGWDNTTFRGLKEYRPGMELRGISWKHFARQGRPLVREDGINSSPRSIILMDRRPLEKEREDLLLENSLTYINRQRGGKDPIQLAGFLPGKFIYLQDEADWQALIRGSLTLKFDSNYLVDCPVDPMDSVTLISALSDGGLLEQDFWKNHPQWQLIALLEGMETSMKTKRISQLEGLKDLGINVVIIEKGEAFWAAG